MKINQVEELVGITKKNIRFYEEQGLITPERNPENGYREYSLKDVEQLQKIKLLRQLDVPIEQIRNLEEEKLSLKECLENHMITLAHKQHEMEMMKEICIRMAEQETDLKNMKPSEYFNDIHEMEERGVRFMNIQETDIKKRRVAPIVVSTILIASLVITDAIVLWMSFWYDPETPIAVPIISTILNLLLIVSIIVVLRQRLREIKGGELYEASKY